MLQSSNQKSHSSQFAVNSSSDSAADDEPENSGDRRISELTNLICLMHSKNRLAISLIGQSPQSPTNEEVDLILRQGGTLRLEYKVQFPSRVSRSFADKARLEILLEELQDLGRLRLVHEVDRHLGGDVLTCYQFCVIPEHDAIVLGTLHSIYDRWQLDSISVEELTTAVSNRLRLLRSASRFWLKRHLVHLHQLQDAVPADLRKMKRRGLKRTTGLVFITQIDESCRRCKQMLLQIETRWKRA